MYPYGIAWALILGWRILAIRRWFTLPTFHGADYFFDMRAPAEFYQGDGRPLMRRYRKLVLLPLAIELLVSGVAGFLSHWDFRILFAIGAIGAFAGMFRIGLIRKVAKQGYDRIGYPEKEAPPATVTLSLAPRELKEYRVAWFEWLIRGMLVLGLGMLAYGGAHEGSQANWPRLLGIPLGFLYLLLGLHLVQKHLVTARLLRLPAGAPEKYLAYREDFRRHWLRMADLVRVLLAAILLIVGIENILPDGWFDASFYAFQGLLWASIAVFLIGALRLTSQFLARARQVGPYVQRAKPVPEPTQARGFAGYFCWESGLTGMIVRGEKHNLFNLGCPQMRTYAFYFAGWALFFGLAFF